jgi:hypothetical protein
MHRFIQGGCLAMLLIGAALASAQPNGTPASEGKLVKETFYAAYLDGNRAGYIHTSIRELERNGQKLYATRIYLELTLRRFQDVVRQQVESGTVETDKGKVTAVWMSQGLGKDQKLTLAGTVEGEQLVVKVSGPMNLERKIPWNDQVIGLYREQQIFKEKNVKPGEKFSYQHYEPMVNAVVTVQAVVKDFEAVEIAKAKRLLLRVETVPEKILTVQLPPTTFWLDKDLQVVRTQTDMPSLGKLSTLRTTKETALSPVTPAQITDIGISQLIPLNRRIARPHDASAIVYKVVLPNDEEPAKSIAADNRQKIDNIKGKSFELHVRAVRKPEAIKEPAKPGEEFLKSNYFINSDDAKVRELAKKAVGQETDPWRKAQRIEKWVHDNMKILNFTEAMATADHVAKTLEGDCTEHAMLTAAMCRAAGLPSRTAIGVVYVDMPKGPVFGYHMWTEVYVQGQWLGLDATLGRGSLGAGHIKITDHSWHETRSLAPLLPVMRVMLGKVAIEVVRVESGE